MLEPLLDPQDLTGDIRNQREKRFRHVTYWRSDDINDLVRWVVSRINALYLALINPSYFLKDDLVIDYIKQRQYYLTINRIVSETITVNTELDSYLRKLLFFDILDKYANLSADKVDLRKRETNIPSTSEKEPL